MHPLGGLIALGTSPLISVLRRFLFQGFGIGAEAIRVMVYGWRGFEMIELEGPYSTTFPAYITTRRSESYSATEMLCVIMT